MTLTTRSLFWLGLLISALGWASTAIVVLFVPPSGPTVFLLLECVFFAISGLTMAFLALTFRLRGSERPAQALREGMLAGLFAVSLLILQYFELLSVEIGAGMALVLLLFEGVLLYRERSREAAIKPPRSRQERRRSGRRPASPSKPN